MRFTTTFFTLLALAQLGFALPHNRRQDQARPPADETVPAAEASSADNRWWLHTIYSGHNFEDSFNFWNHASPTAGGPDLKELKGTARYVDEATADQEAMALRTPQGGFRLNVGSVVGKQRNALRLESKEAFFYYLAVIDVNHVPEGDGVWPAFWSLADERFTGAPWPHGGEIDIIEGMDNRDHNLPAVHTWVQHTEDCAIPQNLFGASNHSVDAQGNPSDYELCWIQNTPTQAQSFGPGLNANGGGTFALQWDSNGISYWFWPRGSAPAALNQDSAVEGYLPEDPSTVLGPPQWKLPLVDDHGKEYCPGEGLDRWSFQKFIINTELCGNYVGNYDECQQRILSDPKSVENAYWDISWIKIYSPKAGGYRSSKIVNQ